MSVTHGLRFDRASFTHRPSCCGDSDLVSSAMLGRGSSPSFGGDFCVWLGLRRGLLRLGDVSDSRSSGGLMWAAENRCGDTKGDPADGEVDRAGMGMACSFLPVLLRRRVPGCARRNPFRCTIGDIGSTGVLLLCRDERLSEGACVSDPGEPCWRAAAVVREKCIALLRWLRLRGWPGDNIAAENAQELSNGLARSDHACNTCRSQAPKQGSRQGDATLRLLWLQRLLGCSA